MIKTDVVIIGAGPCGLFQVFELGLLGLHAHVIEALDHPGGQCSELYPDKPIYDIPACPAIGAQELTDRLLEQIAPFNPTFHYGQEVIALEKQPDGAFLLRTSKDQQFLTRAVIIAAGMGAFQPVQLRVDGLDKHDGKTVFYKVNNPEQFRDQDLVVLGGGDSALDWVLELQPIARSLVLVHRSLNFRAAPASVKKMEALCDQLQMQLLTGTVSDFSRTENGQFEYIKVSGGDGVTRKLELDKLLVFFGLSPKLGTFAEWGLDLHKQQIKVDTEKFQSSQPGIYAVGDINWYPGKKKLILSGFHEAALAAFAIKEQLQPDKKVHLQYTTTSPIMHQRLGVDDPMIDEVA
jgi:thioredoxin reductase (NADPH)